MLELMVAVGIGLVGAAGAYLVLSRDRILVILGLALLGSAASLVVFAAGGIASRPPILSPDGAPPPDAADPVPQALVLTAIVIGFALACLGMAIVLALQRHGSNDNDEPDPGEPAPNDDGSPGAIP
jgi:multicomponent Na+:H+ antiporter subunit C